MRRDQEYVGKRVMETELPGKREAKEKIFGCSEGGYGETWCKGTLELRSSTTENPCKTLSKKTDQLIH